MKEGSPLSYLTPLFIEKNSPTTHSSRMKKKSSYHSQYYMDPPLSRHYIMTPTSNQKEAIKESNVSGIPPNMMGP